MNTKRISGYGVSFTVEANSNKAATRLTFTERNSYQPAYAIWDLTKQEWVPCRCEFGGL